jgi:branched-chain amino acid transport system ATP-binding protein
MTGATQPILSVRGLSARIAGQQVVEDVTFDVAKTGVTALLGRNGVGKTSTIKGILGLIERKGEVTLFGEDDGGQYSGERIDRQRTHRIVQRGIGYVPEDREIFAKLTVNENLRLAERDANPHREFVASLFPDLVARSGQLAGTLSGGQQQMVSLARALINTNRLLLVDEPTKGLAPIIVTEVAAALDEAAKTVPVLLVEQNLQVVRRLATDVVVIAGGRVVHTGPAVDFLDDPSLIRRFLGVHTDDAEPATGSRPARSESAS